MDSPLTLSESSFPDTRIAIYTDHGRIEIDRWLTMEFLGTDFLSFISEFTEVTPEQRERVLTLSPVNAL